jgi:putative aminopeptidase FrvX
MQTKILSELCSIPTAPFAEQHVVEYVKSFVSTRPALRLSQDRFGNLLIALPSKIDSPRWIFTAHMDHPGFIAEKMISRRMLRATFRGFVYAKYVKGTKVLFFDANREIAGKVTEVSMQGSERPDIPASVTVRVDSEVSPGLPGMFDQGVGQIRGGKFYSRVCDDLAGAAACLTMLDELTKKPPKSTIAVLLTRGEEEGFIGAIAAATEPKLIRKSDRLVAIECSAMQPYAPQGAGTIIRVGDRSSVFNSDLTYFITAQAAKLAEKEKDFKYQRALMPGGTCEATVYDIYGFIAASICVPLGNYHNMDVAKKKIGPEFVDVNDWKNMARLFVHLARTAHEYEPGHKLLKMRVEKRFKKLSHLLEAKNV